MTTTEEAKGGPAPAEEWHPTACVACGTNCGIEVRLGGPDGRHFEKIRGDRAHPISQGYTCQKALQLDYYQNGRDRLLHPLRRRPDGTFERIDWETAISEVAAKFKAVRDSHGGESILYYGGGGQGNHLGGAYSGATRRALGARFRSNALAQEKTGLFWVNQQMAHSGDAHHLKDAEVAVFVGKNPWQSHGIPRARVTLREISKDPDRTLIVIDPRRSETAEIADIHLRLKPGTDAWLLAALGGVLVQEDLVDGEWLSAHANGVEEVISALARVPIANYAAIAGVPEEQVREVARRVGRAGSVCVEEDLGIEMSLHSTLCSYLRLLLPALTGNLARPGAPRALPLMSITSGPARPRGAPPRPNVTPVTGSRIISGLLPCNVIPEEILTDHPDRFRAMLIESANPVHSLADSPRMREALSALDLLVVMD
ncbi:MAG: molybdopterin-dependent oxidoreductase, partial [Dehalococcoidia bacterium]